LAPLLGIWTINVPLPQETSDDVPKPACIIIRIRIRIRITPWTGALAAPSSRHDALVDWLSAVDQKWYLSVSLHMSVDIDAGISGVFVGRDMRFAPLHIRHKRRRTLFLSYRWEVLMIIMKPDVLVLQHWNRQQKFEWF
jgi:hypothetical protein